MTPPYRELQRQAREIRKQLAKLQKEIGAQQAEGEDLLDCLHEPKSFAQLLLATGSEHNELIHHLYRLEKVGKIERWDQPRWIRSDIAEGQKSRMIFEETPLRQKDLEILLARRAGRAHDTKLDRPPASDRIQKLKEEGLVQLGDKRGDPWFLPPAPGARGTRDISPDQRQQLKSVPAPERDTQYQQHRPRHVRSSEAPPKPRSRDPKGGS